MNCPHCHSSSTSEREGRTVHGFRRFRCRDCGRRYNERTGTVLNRVQVPTDIMFLFWRLRYKLSLRDLAEMFLIRGLVFTHEAVRDREAKLAPRLAGKAGRCWHVDETYVKVAGEWCYLYRAIDRDGNLVDVYLSETRDMAAAKAFLRSARSVTQVEPEQVTTDGHTSYPKAEELGTDVDHRTSQYKNNVMEQDHRGVKGALPVDARVQELRCGSSLLPRLRRGSQLSATGYLHQPERLACSSPDHPRAARGCAAGPDLRRLIQLMVGRHLSAAQLAPKADRTGPASGAGSELR